MCEIIQLPLENINYRFLYLRAKDKCRPIFEVWADSHNELIKLCDTLSKIKHATSKYVVITGNSIKKEFQPAPFAYDKQADGKHHIYIEMHTASENINSNEKAIFDFFKKI